MSRGMRYCWQPDQTYHFAICNFCFPTSPHPSPLDEYFVAQRFCYLFWIYSSYSSTSNLEMKEAVLQGSTINIIYSIYVGALSQHRRSEWPHLIILRKVKLIIFKIKLKTEFNNIPVLQSLVCFKPALGSWQHLISTEILIILLWAPESYSAALMGIIGASSACSLLSPRHQKCLSDLFCDVCGLLRSPVKRSVKATGYS